MDLDEEIYLKGQWKVRMYGEAWTPANPRFMQGSKQQVERASEEEIIEGLANHISDIISNDDHVSIIYGALPPESKIKQQEKELRAAVAKAKANGMTQIHFNGEIGRTRRSSF